MQNPQSLDYKYSFTDDTTCIWPHAEATHCTNMHTLKKDWLF